VLAEMRDAYFRNKLPNESMRAIDCNQADFLLTVSFHPPGGRLLPRLLQRQHDGRGRRQDHVPRQRRGGHRSGDKPQRRKHPGQFLQVAAENQPEGPLQSQPSRYRRVADKVRGTGRHRLLCNMQMIQLKMQ
jgi:hypothetical protein